MEKTNKIPNSNPADSILHFIEETKNGNYTTNKPEVVEINYFRLDNPESTTIMSSDEYYNDDNTLFGILY